VPTGLTVKVAVLPVQTFVLAGATVQVGFA